MHEIAFSPLLARTSLRNLPAIDAQAGTSKATASNIVFPPEHLKALHPDRTLVVGMRGAGKTYWCNALLDTKMRELLGVVLPDMRLGQFTHCSPGFGIDPLPAYYPGQRGFSELLTNFDAAHVWWSIVGTQLFKAHADLANTPIGFDPELDWSAQVTWFRQNAVAVEEALARLDAQLATAGRAHLIVFDALDRTSATWAQIRNSLRGLLKILLEFRSYRSIRLKAFVRPDMLDDSEVASFPDASKVISGRVVLQWSNTDLYNLLWRHCANDSNFGSEFRNACTSAGAQSWTQTKYAGGASYFLPKTLNQNEELQRTLFHAISGPFMGRDRRKGYPYTWLPNHLADELGHVSPRSFIAALQAAADVTFQSHADYRYALHHDAIKSGVEKASVIRKAEIEEDYSWVRHSLSGLKGLNVPVSWKEIRGRWLKEDLIGKLPELIARDDPDHAKSHLLPDLRFREDSLRDALIGLGVLSKMREQGKINMPDVYRVAFGIGRKGGQPPVRSR